MSKKQIELLPSREVEIAYLSDQIRQRAVSGEVLEILEAGCGPKWMLDLSNVNFRLTGLDINKNSLEIRQNEIHDLDKGILGDLRYAELENEFYDVIYCSYVLEHISGSEGVLNNFYKWLKPGGILILRIPDGDSVYGFLTKSTPFWVHLFYKKYIKRISMAGKPGYGPFPTVHDDVVSVKGIREYSKKKQWTILKEYGSKYNLDGDGVFRVPIVLLIYIIQFLSLGKLTARHNNLTYVMQK